MSLTTAKLRRKTYVEKGTQTIAELTQINPTPIDIFKQPEANSNTKINELLEKIERNETFSLQLLLQMKDLKETLFKYNKEKR